MSYEIGIDVGGTFTDFVVRSADEILSGKVLTTPNDETAGIMNAIRTSAEHFSLDSQNFLKNADNLVLGTTVVTNAMLEYAGAKTGLITTKGFRDIIELRTGYKEDHFDIRLPAPYPIVPRQRRLGVTERINHLGEIVLELNEEEVRDAVARLKQLNVESIAVCLLFSFKNNEHESRIREIIREEYPQAYVSLSCEVLPQVREFDRFSTTWGIRNPCLMQQLRPVHTSPSLRRDRSNFASSTRFIFLPRH